MKEKIRIAVVDDHELMLKGICSSLGEFSNYETECFSTCDDVFAAIKEYAETNPFQILFTDLSFDNQTEYTKIDGGESLIKKIKKESIPIKIGVITGHTETNRVFNVINNLKPNAYLLKGSCSASELHFTVQQLMKGEFFYTHEIHQKILKRNIVQIQMDEVAIQILKELPKQAKIINLEGRIKKMDGTDMKIRAIENKLANLRIDLNAKNNTDLVLKAKELGIID